MVVISSPSLADSPHQQDDVASSPAVITPPKTVLAPDPVPLPKGDRNFRTYNDIFKRFYLVCYTHTKHGFHASHANVQITASLLYLF